MVSESHGRSILIVGNKRTEREQVSRLMRDLCPVALTEANNGWQALSAMALMHRGVDLVISEVAMPDYNGIELLKAVRTGAAGIPHDTPFALMTDGATPLMVQLAARLEVDTFLVKPLCRDSLAERALPALGGRKARQERAAYAAVDISAYAESGRDDLRAVPEPLDAVPGRAGPKGVVLSRRPTSSAADERLISARIARETQVLARDLKDSTGKLLLAKGTPLTPGIIARLKSIGAMDKKAARLWVRRQT